MAIITHSIAKGSKPNEAPDLACALADVLAEAVAAQLPANTPALQDVPGHLPQTATAENHPVAEAVENPEIVDTVGIVEAVDVVEFIVVPLQDTSSLYYSLYGWPTGE
ncbi:hypothetical protein FRC11_001928 [Ceratobasidium sp. 423]|nr:hypothetical protein FRC11_001928 [Ceratobasidium sp. 423]